MIFTDNKYTTQKIFHTVHTPVVLATQTPACNVHKQASYYKQTVLNVCLLDLMLFVPIDSFSLIMRQFPGLNQYKV